MLPIPLEVFYHYGPTRGEGEFVSGGVFFEQFSPVVIVVVDFSVFLSWQSKFFIRLLSTGKMKVSLAN